jgi:hypothetical protein
VTRQDGPHIAVGGVVETAIVVTVVVKIVVNYYRPTLPATRLGKPPACVVRA